ncbi:MAG TPA: VOC family protein [Actinomycetes bacterium]|jgi:4a-hydroxytetrahydrobiopterin dehydratase|nr:VOC family protein [Actinomycetes bacterium]
MSERGWQEFLAAEDAEDWVVLHGGATAVFRVSSLGEAARLAEAVACVPGLQGSGVLLTVADDRLAVRLSRGVFRLEERHIDLARAVSATALAHGAVADRSGVQGVQVAIAARPDAIDVGFWRAVLGYVPLAEDNAIDPLGHGSTVWMQELDPGKSPRHAMHVDVSVPREQAEERLAAALAAGGRIVDDSQAPETWILADRAGNRVCIAAWPDGAPPPAPTAWAGRWQHDRTLGEDSARLPRPPGTRRVLRRCVGHADQRRGRQLGCHRCGSG